MSDAKKRKSNDNQETIKDKLPVKKNRLDDGKKSNNFFSGVKFFVSDWGIGKTRAGLFKKQILKFGGIVKETLCEGTSYAVVDDSITCEQIHKLFGFEDEEKRTAFSKLHIVKISWISACLKEKNLLPADDFSFDWKSVSTKKVEEAQNPEPSSNESQDGDKEQKKFPKTGVMWRAFPKKVILT